MRFQNHRQNSSRNKTFSAVLKLVVLIFRWSGYEVSLHPDFSSSFLAVTTRLTKLNFLSSLIVLETWWLHSPHQTEGSKNDKDAENTEVNGDRSQRRTTRFFNQDWVHIFCCLLLFSLCSFNKYNLCKQWRRLPKAASLPPPSLSAEKCLLEFSKRCMTGNNLRESGCSLVLSGPQCLQLKKKKSQPL